MLTLAFMYCLKHPFAVAVQDAWPGKYAVICNSGYAEAVFIKSNNKWSLLCVEHSESAMKCSMWNKEIEKRAIEDEE